MPADFKTGTIDRYFELNQKYSDSQITETYGQLTTGAVINSGRAIGMISNVDYTKLEKYVGYSKNKGIDFHYTLNPSCMGNAEFSTEGVKKIKGLVRNLYNLGIRSFTITTPSLIETVKSLGLDFHIKASAICEIMTPDKALFYKGLGCERIVVDPDITRDFKRLKLICEAFGKGVELIVNNVCLKHCAYKMFHYNHEAHAEPGNKTQTFHDYYYNRCHMQKARDIKNVIRLNWVRPEDLKYYMQTGIEIFKIQGRQNVEKGDPAKAVEAYMKEEYQGNLYDLITIFAPYSSFQPYIDNQKLDGFVKRFFDDPGFCRNTCAGCGYCESFARRCMSMEETEELNKEALAYFNEIDNYTRLNREEKVVKNTENQFKAVMHNFDFE
jgi:collagenase-like PrtC family protease